MSAYSPTRHVGTGSVGVGLMAAAVGAGMLGAVGGVGVGVAAAVAFAYARNREPAAAVRAAQSAREACAATLPLHDFTSIKHYLEVLANAGSMTADNLSGVAKNLQAHALHVGRLADHYTNMEPDAPKAESARAFQQALENLARAALAASQVS